jgi:OmcA/MtrC family decaheme c-type cytochrome
MDFGAIGITIAIDRANPDARKRRSFGGTESWITTTLNDQQHRLVRTSLARLLTVLALIGPPAATISAQSGPGIKATIIGVTIPAQHRLVVAMRIADLKDHPLELSDLDADSIRFTVAAIKTEKNGEIRYHNYILTRVIGEKFVYKNAVREPALAESLQPGFDDGGVLTPIKPGVFTYTFKTPLPGNYDRNATHVVGGEITREKGRYVANPLFEFVPSGGKVKAQRAVVETATCNNCHDPLKYHGGTRRAVGYCALCHTSQLADPESGENLEFKVFVHKIHRGKLLPSVKNGKPYFMVGPDQQVADYTNLRYTQVVMSDGVAKDLRNCKACHGGAKSENWKQFPSGGACTSCHDNVDLRTGQNHIAGPQAEGTCIGCHLPEGPEFGPSIAGAHTFPGWSRQLPGIVFDILKIEGTQPGQNPVVTFSVKSKEGEAINAAEINNLRLVVAWPTTDYEIAVEEDVRKAESRGDGVYTHKFKYTIPTEATGSGAIGIQGYKLTELKKPNGNVIKDVRDVGYNIVKYFPITDKEAVPRRQAVKIENCNVCHAMLATHGEARRNAEFCVMCHNPSHTDEEKRKAANGPMPPENVHYKRLIHRIHTGVNAGEPFIVYGGPPARPGPVDLSDIRFPGDRRNCVKCHVPGANEPPLPAGLLPTLIPQADGTLKALPPITSACIACHTRETAKAHVETLTASNGQESCVVCHGVGREFAVEKVHRR